MSFSAEPSIPMKNSGEQLSSSISSSIYVIAGNVARIQRNVDVYGSAIDSSNLRQQTTTLIEETRYAIKTASTQLKEYMAIPSQSNVRRQY